MKERCMVNNGQHVRQSSFHYLDPRGDYGQRCPNRNTSILWDTVRCTIKISLDLSKLFLENAFFCLQIMCLHRDLNNCVLLSGKCSKSASKSLLYCEGWATSGWHWFKKCAISLHKLYINTVCLLTGCLVINAECERQVHQSHGVI